MKFMWMALTGWTLAALALAAFCCPAVSRADARNQGHEARTMVPVSPAALSPASKLPAVDAAVPAPSETATFSLG